MLRRYCSGISRLSRSLSTSAAARSSRSVVVVGGNGAFGQSVVSKFKSDDWNTISFDLTENKNADVSIQGTGSWHEDVEALLKRIAEEKSNGKVHAVVCAAGGWAGGGLDDAEALIEGAEAMIFACYKTSITAACVASQHMEEGGLLVLTGSAAATTPNAGAVGMLGYCMAKSATHYLSQVVSKAGLPADSRSVCLLPEVLDTPANRAAMPDADQSEWTSPDELAEMVRGWADACSSPGGASSAAEPIPDSGDLVKPVMDAGKVSGWEVAKDE